ncbi:MAG: flavin reductase, partial [Oscillospiraceae bacterium]
MNPLVFKNLTYGMYAIGVKDGEKPSACIINSVTQISKANPCLVAISMNKENYSCCCIKKNGIFSISVLSQETPGTVIGALGLVSGRKAS